jgi:hypothetical protein
MIDINFKELPKQNISDMALLILLNDNCNYCTEAIEWADILYKSHPNSYKINFRQLFNRIGFRGLQDYILDFIEKNKINVVYFNSPFDVEFDIPFLERLRNKVFVVMYFDDIALFFNDSYRYIIQCVDLALSHDYVEKYRFELFGTKSLFFPMFDPGAADCFKDGEFDKDIEVSFIGRTDRIGREEFIDFLRQENIGLELYGAGTDKGVISQADKINIFKRSKIGLNFTGPAEYFHNKSVRKIDKKIRQVKGRIWELAFCKNLVLTEYAPCLEKNFKIGEEIVVFTDEKDLLDKIRFYQKNRQEREKIALNGFQRAYNDYHPVNGCKNLLRLMYKYSSEKKYFPSKIILDDDFLENLSVSRGICGIRFIKQRKYKLALEEFKLIYRTGRFNIFEIFGWIFRELFRPAVNKIHFLKKIVARIRGITKPRI